LRIGAIDVGEVEMTWLEWELVKINALQISWWKKFRLRILAGKASSNFFFKSAYYLKLHEYTKKVEGEEENEIL